MYHYYMFNKPFGCVTARRDDKFPVVMDHFRELDNPDLSPVGRLDRETEGLLFITDDGMWNRKMTLPGEQREKRYEFIVMGDLSPEKVEMLERGVLLRGDDTPTAPCSIEITGHSTLGEVLPNLHPDIQRKSAHNPMERPMTFGAITITEGRYRQIRRMMKVVRCLVLSLKRVSMDGIPLDPDLKPGEWKELFLNV